MTDQNTISRYTPPYLVAKVMVGIDERFLLKKGIERAREQRLEINLGGECTLTTDNNRGSINLPSHEGGVDVRELIALIADDYPKKTIRYLSNRKRLGM